MLGYALNKNIMAGLLTGLMLSWLDRYCKGFTKEEMKKSSPLSSIEKMVNPKGVVMDASNAFGNFTKGYSSFIKSNIPKNPVQALTKPDFLTKILTGNVESCLNNLRSSEISSTDKRNYMSSITDKLSTTDPNSQEYKNLLQAKGDLVNLPLISGDRRDTAIQYSNLSDKLGTMAKSIKDVDPGEINTYNLSEIDKGLADKISDFKVASVADPDLMTRGTESGAFDDYDFGKVMPNVTSSEEAHLTAADFDSDDDHRIHDMHPTTEVFLEEGVYV
jgi:hypothetical protein